MTVDLLFRSNLGRGSSLPCFNKAMAFEAKGFPGEDAFPVEPNAVSIPFYVAAYQAASRRYAGSYQELYGEDRWEDWVEEVGKMTPALKTLQIRQAASL